MGYYDDPANQIALNVRWWQENRDRQQVRENRMAEKVTNGFHTQTPEEVQAALDRAKEESGVLPLPPVVAAPAVGANRDGSPTTVRNFSTVMRRLILDGLSNAEVFAQCVLEFGSEEMPEAKKGYPAWYRGQLSKEGLLPTELATNNTRSTKGMNFMAAPTMTRNVGNIASTMESQMKYLQETIDNYGLEVEALKKMQVGLEAAHNAYCVSVEEDPATYVSPMTEKLQANASRATFLESELIKNDLELRGLDAAYDAYMAVVTAPEDDETPDEDAAPPEPPPAPEPEAPKAQAKKKSGGTRK